MKIMLEVLEPVQVQKYGMVPGKYYYGGVAVINVELNIFNTIPAHKGNHLNLLKLLLMLKQ